ncbi:hypothetical protein HBF26_19060 [Luteibacter jiangsuensis]|uniref:Cyanobacterial TRADD-N associated 2 transmembrane domain-containing protein n=1 Tax=Luteibacter jiangsuensis TaxID=637577 RepID=A0ABX0Q9F2_9GAMM|nr:hypothetical protein [Luteibacter jiangsuensis]NID06993.1 hypothetical protein [Luteibacter jiangsuensis]
MLDNFVWLFFRYFKKASTKLRLLLLCSIATGALVAGTIVFFHEDSQRSDVAAASAAGAALVISLIAALEGATELSERAKELERAEAQTQAHPDKPLLAWDAGRLRLESYLDRNLSQVRAIFWLTILVMLVGFCLIVFGLMRAMAQPDRLPIAVVSAASGVLVSFLGGSFLLIYRSTLRQSTEFVSVLERINAVGMAVQVIESIPLEPHNLRHETSAALARKLLALYGASRANPAKEKSKAKM